MRLLWTWLGGVMALAIGATCWRTLDVAEAHAAPPHAQILVENERLDVGTLPRGALTWAEFWVQNRGEDRLVLVGVGDACCGRVGRQVLAPPGARALIRVNVTAPQTPGEFEQTFAFTTNDPDRPKLALSVIGIVAD